jgi:hypothetical protein
MSARGQTTVDFAVGMGVFLLAVAFVFAFVPTTFVPFSGDDGRQMVLADRTADHLTDDLLVADPRDPAVTNATCATGFFDADGAVPADCRYDQDAADLDDALDVQTSTSRLNVSVERNGGVATLDGVRLAAGGDPPARSTVSVARRLTLLDERRYSVYVRVW